MGQLSRSSVSRAGSEVEAMVPRKKTGAKDQMVKAVILSQNL